MSFDGRTAIVTGAGRGLGRQHALLLASRGAKVVVNDVRDELSAGLARADAVVGEIEATGGRAAPSYASVDTPAGGAEIVDTALDAFGRVDIVVNNAGILRDRSLGKLSVEELVDVVQVHLLGAFHVTLPAFRSMREQGYGRFVHTTSASGLYGNFGQANYAAAKTGLLGLSNVLAIEGERHGIKSNLIAPLAATTMTEGMFNGLAAAFDPAFVSPMVAYLASDECAVSGEAFAASAGQLSRIFIGVSTGIFRPGRPFSPEEIAGRIDEIRDTGDFDIPQDLDAEIAKLVGRLRSGA